MHTVAKRLAASGSSTRQTAAVLGVTVRTLYRCRECAFRPRAPPSGGRPHKLTDAIVSVLLHHIEQTVWQEAHIAVHRSTISRWLRKMGITRKVAVLSNTEITLPRVVQARKLFRTRMRQAGRDGMWYRYYNVDECGWHLNRCRRYGYAAHGQRAIIQRPAARGQRYTLVLVVGAGGNYTDRHPRTRARARRQGNSSGVAAWQLVPGSMTGVLFQQLVANMEIPRDSYLVMDNASIHHAAQSLSRQGIPAVRATLNSRAVEPVYLPPYSPDLAPIELIFNNLRTEVDRQEPRTEAQLRRAIRSFIDRLTLNSVHLAYSHAWT